MFLDAVETRSSDFSPSNIWLSSLTRHVYTQDTTAANSCEMIYTNALNAEGYFEREEQRFIPMMKY